MWQDSWEWLRMTVLSSWISCHWTQRFAAAAEQGDDLTESENDPSVLPWHSLPDTSLHEFPSLLSVLFQNLGMIMFLGGFLSTKNLIRDKNLSAVWTWWQFVSQTESHGHRQKDRQADQSSCARVTQWVCFPSAHRRSLMDPVSSTSSDSQPD